jgi:potassium channel
MLMLLCSCYNTFANAYYAAFGTPTNLRYVAFDYGVEFLFFLDICFCFLTQTVERKTYGMLTRVQSIAKNYLKSSFILDLLALVPFELFLCLGSESCDKNRLLRLFKWLRLTRLF